MHINELDQYRLSDAVRFHDRLNPALWDEREQLRPEVRAKLLAIAHDFQESLGVEDLDLEDITISGSNAAYSYTPTSDIDLHLVVRMPQDPIYQELFNAKKYQYNDEHDIRIRGADVELYVQPQDQPHVSLGIYSVMNDKWLRVPSRRRANLDDSCVQSKTQDLENRITSAIESRDADRMKRLWDKIRNMRKIGLQQHGEFGCENLSFKLLRNSGALERLKSARQQQHDQELSLAEQDREPVRYGFRAESLDKPTPTLLQLVKKHGVSLAQLQNQLRRGIQVELEHTSDRATAREIALDHLGEFPDYYDRLASAEQVKEEGSSPSGVSPGTHMFVSETPDQDILKMFIDHTAQHLGIERMPRVHLHSDAKWSEANHSFGRYDPETHDLHVSLPNRHILDVMRTTAHELAHCRQNEIAPLPDHAGETGSDWENEAHAVAGIIMRDFADHHPDYFERTPLHEGIDTIPQSTRRAIAAACMALGLQGCGTMGETLKTTRDVARLATQIQQAGRPGMQEELTQELRNYVRAHGGDANAQNQSVLYRREQPLKEGGWDNPITQNTRITPATVRSALYVMRQYVRDFNEWSQYPPIRLGHPTGSSAYYEVDDPNTEYGDIDLQIVVPDLPETQGLTQASRQGFWNRLWAQWIKAYHPMYVHPQSEPGHPILRIGSRDWAQVDLMPHTEQLAQWGRYRVTPERGTKGLLMGNMFSVLGQLMNMSIQHGGVEYKERDGVKQPYTATRKNYVLKNASTNIEQFILDILRHEYHDITGQDSNQAQVDPLLAQNPGVDVKNPNIERLARGIQGLARSFELNQLYGKKDLAPYASAQDFLRAFLERYNTKSQEAISATKFDKAETEAAQARAQRDKERIAQGTQRVNQMFALRESSGYIPTQSQRRDPRFIMALTQDVQPGEIGRQANRLNLKTDQQGHPRMVFRSRNQLGE